MTLDTLYRDVEPDLDAALEEVELESSASVLNEDLAEIKGFLGSVPLNSGWLAIRDVKTASVTLMRWNHDTVVLRQKHPYARETLLIGERVTVRYEMIKGSPVAKTIVVDARKHRNDLPSPKPTLPTGPERAGRHYRRIIRRSPRVPGT